MPWSLPPGDVFLASGMCVSELGHCLKSCEVRMFEGHGASHGHGHPGLGLVLRVQHPDRHRTVSAWALSVFAEEQDLQHFSFDKGMLLEAPLPR